MCTVVMEEHTLMAFENMVTKREKVTALQW